MFGPLLHLLYPHTCESCGHDLSRTEEVLCLACAHHLPVTGFQLSEGNPVERIFHGRIALRHATAGYYFGRQSRLQQLVHQFKYHGRKDIALYLGRQLGLQLRQSAWWQEISAVIPVPLHAVKQRHRGYNQASLLAAGIAGVLGCHTAEALERIPNSDTQTRKSRMERWENVSTAFALKATDALESGHVLLVDDVLTTGATMEACARAIMTANNMEVSICSLAYANK